MGWWAALQQLTHTRYVQLHINRSPRLILTQSREIRPPIASSFAVRFDPGTFEYYKRMSFIWALPRLMCKRKGSGRRHSFLRAYGLLN